jgi:hypothetical protein
MPIFLLTIWSHCHGFGMFKFTNKKEKHEMLIGGVDACKVWVLSLLGLLVLSYVPSHDDTPLCLLIGSSMATIFWLI